MLRGFCGKRGFLAKISYKDKRKVKWAKKMLHPKSDFLRVHQEYYIILFPKMLVWLVVPRNYLNIKILQ